jgi:hypothetical protein
MWEGKAGGVLSLARDIIAASAALAGVLIVYLVLSIIIIER